jgi:hypothetical protein
MTHAFLIIHAAISWSLIGLIWTIQVVHYPLFRDVGPAEFVAYHDRHMRLISWIVGPLMLAEVGSAALLIYLGERSAYFWISLTGLALVWASTIFYQVPIHEKLTLGYDAKLIRQLVRGNWWRTCGWSLRGMCLVMLIFTQT